MQHSAIDAQLFESYGISVALSGYSSMHCSYLFSDGVSLFPIESQLLQYSARLPFLYIIFGYLYSIFKLSTLYVFIFLELVSFFILSCCVLEKFCAKHLKSALAIFFVLSGLTFSTLTAHFTHFNYVFSFIYVAIICLVYAAHQKSTRLVVLALILLGSIRVETAMMAISFGIWYFLLSRVQFQFSTGCNSDSTTNTQLSSEIK